MGRRVCRDIRGSRARRRRLRRTPRACGFGRFYACERRANDAGSCIALLWHRGTRSSIICSSPKGFRNRANSRGGPCWGGKRCGRTLSTMRRNNVQQCSGTETSHGKVGAILSIVCSHDVASRCVALRSAMFAFATACKRVTLRTVCFSFLARSQRCGFALRDGTVQGVEASSVCAARRRRGLAALKVCTARQKLAAFVLRGDSGA